MNLSDLRELGRQYNSPARYLVGLGAPPHHHPHHGGGGGGHHGGHHGGGFRRGGFGPGYLYDDYLTVYSPVIQVNDWNQVLTSAATNGASDAVNQIRSSHGVPKSYGSTRAMISSFIDKEIKKSVSQFRSSWGTPSDTLVASIKSDTISQWLPMAEQAVLQTGVSGIGSFGDASTEAAAAELNSIAWEIIQKTQDAVSNFSIGTLDSLILIARISGPGWRFFFASPEEKAMAKLGAARHTIWKLITKMKTDWYGTTKPNNVSGSVSQSVDDAFNAADTWYQNAIDAESKWRTSALVLTDNAISDIMGDIIDRLEMWGKFLDKPLGVELPTAILIGAAILGAIFVLK